MCSIAAGLGALSAVTKFAAASQRASAENEARRKNRASALADYNRKIETNQRNYIAESRATQQRSFDQELKKREALGAARADAGTQGAAGISVNAVFNEIVGQGARNLSRLEDEQEVNELDYENRGDTYLAQTESRVNANQPVPGPSPLGLFINVATAVNDGLNE